ncbi:MAG: glycosyltransferase [Burkholderiales bacterium]
MKLVCFSTLFPSSARPGHGIFVETRLRELLKLGGIEAKVVAPVPWFPSKHPRFGSYARMAATPLREQRNGLDVLHPRYFLPPKVGMHMAPWSLFQGAKRSLTQLRDEGFDFDLIDAHYFYPDGVAAVELGRYFNRPVTVTARGSDLHFITQFAGPRRRMQQAAAKADASIGVCNALVDVLRDWSIPSSRLHVFRNGVDLERFRPIPQQEARTALGLQGSPLLLSVGRLVELKGHHIAIEALSLLRAQHPQARLVLLGEGEEREPLRQLADRLGLADAVLFAGAQPNDKLLQWYSAADLFLLCSSREGWANVLLEAMACGTPVLATATGGTPEVLTDPRVGTLVQEREARAFASAALALLARGVDRAAVRAYAAGFGWRETSEAQQRLFAQLIDEHRKGSQDA